jgi:hypothetical protein
LSECFFAPRTLRVSYAPAAVRLVHGSRGHLERLPSR